MIKGVMNSEIETVSDEVTGEQYICISKFMFRQFISSTAVKGDDNVMLLSGIYQNEGIILKFVWFHSRAAQNADNGK